MLCDICGREGARIRRVARTYGEGEDLLVIEEIPVVSCPHCVESHLNRFLCLGPALAPHVQAAFQFCLAIRHAGR